MESAAPQVEVGTSFACLFMAVFAIAGLAMFGFWLWMLIDAIQHTPSENNLRLIWILVIVLTGIIGALIYFFMQRPKNQAKAEAPLPPPAQ